jgi:hypothetical protein
MPRDVKAAGFWATVAMPMGMAAIALPCLAHSQSVNTDKATQSILPRLSWIWASAGWTWDQWGGEPLSAPWDWQTKSNQSGGFYNQPQHLRSVQIGAKWMWNPHWGFAVSAPYFLNTRQAMPGKAGASEQGLGSLQWTLDYRAKPFSAGLQLTLPGWHDVSIDPWTDFNVVRLAIPLDWSGGPNRMYLLPSIVAYSPKGDGFQSGGLVDPGDWEIHGGINHTRKFAKRWKGRMGIDYGVSSYHFVRYAQANQSQTLAPTFGISWAPAPKHELAVSFSGTLWSYETGAFTDATVSKKLSLGLYYGWYR